MKGSERRHSYCYPCHVIYKREWRRASPAALKKNRAYAKAGRERLQAEVDALKKGPCSDCGDEFNPWQMQFDHVRGKKIDSVSNLVRHNRRKAVFLEIAKCELVCANCHADRTHNRLHADVM